MNKKYYLVAASVLVFLIGVVTYTSINIQKSKHKESTINQIIEQEINKSQEELTKKDYLIADKWTIEEFYEREDHQKIANELVGEQYPNISLIGESGKVFNLYEAFKGPIILEYASGGCGACLRSVDAVKALKENFPEYNILTIVKDDDSIHKEKFLEAGQTDPLYRVNPSDTYLTKDKFISYGYPLFIFIDENQTVKLIHKGSVEENVITGFANIAFDK